MVTLFHRSCLLFASAMSDTPVESVNFKIKHVVAMGLALGGGMITLLGWGYGISGAVENLKEGQALSGRRMDAMQTVVQDVSLMKQQFANMQAGQDRIQKSLREEQATLSIIAQVQKEQGLKIEAINERSQTRNPQWDWMIHNMETLMQKQGIPPTPSPKK